MAKRQKPKSDISVNITGDVSGQVVVGNHNKVIKSVTRSTVTQAELAALHQSLLELKNRVEVEAPDNKKEDASERLNELEQAVFEKQPDLAVIEHARNWFRKFIPVLTDSVESVVLHPVLNKLVKAAGDDFADEFKKRFL